MNPNSQNPNECAPFVISREFAAPLARVWQAWTERDQFMQWFAPKGVTTRHAEMDFRPGGKLHFCQVTPDGKEMWGKAVYREIIPPKKIVWVHSFSDPAGGLTRHPFSPTWPLQMLTAASFSETQGKTTVTIQWQPLEATAEEIKTFDAARGSMVHGWSGTFDQLAVHLAPA